MPRVEWEPVIGIEVHVQLNTHSKIFSSAPVAFGHEPNIRANLVDIAMPGTLPVLNQEVVRMALMFGLAIDAEIADVCRFDRKNYFYPDLPKGYQISQLDQPIVGRGTLEVVMGDGSIRTIGITRAHLEEDAGKSIHDRFHGKTGIDLNRAGTPLLEVVSEPDIRSAADAAECFRQLHTLVTWLGICDGDLSQGSMRCDANISIRRANDSGFGERTEIKNINSFRFVERALNYEIDRQIGVLERGGEIVRETRLYDADKDETRSMRGKELSDDYRYFPDPDLLPVKITASQIAEVRERLPELPTAKIERYVNEAGLNPGVAVRLTRSHAVSKYFEKAWQVCAEPTLLANWILGEVTGALNKEGLSFTHVRFPAEELAQLVTRIKEGSISSNLAKQVFERIWNNGGKVDSVIAEHGLAQVNDRDELSRLVNEVLAAHPEQVAQYRNGRTKVLGFLVGQVMRNSNGKADPRQVNELMRRTLSI